MNQEGVIVYILDVIRNISSSSFYLP